MQMTFRALAGLLVAGVLVPYLLLPLAFLARLRRTDVLLAGLLIVPVRAPARTERVLALGDRLVLRVRVDSPRGAA